MKPLLAVLVLAATAIPALAQSVPTINIEPSCKAAAAAGGSSGSGFRQDIDSCRRSELAAREVLVKQWSNFNAADRKSCYSLTTTGTPGTYTELLTCLEMKRDARALPDASTVGRGLSSRP